MAESMRELELKEKEREERRKTREEKKVMKARKEAAQSTKKWKGKDWFVIFSPKMFGDKVIGETPATNPKTLLGRNIEVSLSDLTGQYGRDFYRLMFSINRVDKNAVYTRFNGYKTLREHIMRMVRKRVQKIESMVYVNTKDKWRLQISTVAILNRNTEASVKKKVRANIEKILQDTAAESDIDNFVKAVITSKIQRDIKKTGTKIYPVRLCEIAKIEVKSVPSGSGPKVTDAK